MGSRTKIGLIAVALMLGAWTAELSAMQGAKISAGDQLKIVIVNIDMGATEFLVDGEGYINYPNLGRLKVSGMTSTELSTKLGKDLVALEVLTRTPQVMIDLKQLETKSFTVSGAVLNRNVFTFGGQITLFDALIKSGGPAPDAGEDIVVTRRPAQAGGDPETIVVSRRDVESGDFSKNVVVQDGDRIFIPKAQQVFIDGQVTSPNGYVVPPGTTLRQAITLAGGVTELGALNRVKVTRKGKPVDEKLTKEIDKFIVLPGDVISVPKRKM